MSENGQTDATATKRSGRSRVSNIRLPPDASRIIFVQNLPFKLTSSPESQNDLYSIFGKFGAISQIRVGNSQEKKTNGTAYIVFEDVLAAVAAVEKLQGFNVGGRYLKVLFFKPGRHERKAEMDRKQAEIDSLREEFNVGKDEES